MKTLRAFLGKVPCSLSTFYADYHPTPYAVEFQVDDTLFDIKRTLSEVME